jgi:hypothetical protein
MKEKLLGMLLSNKPNSLEEFFFFFFFFFFFGVGGFVYFL